MHLVFYYLRGGGACDQTTREHVQTCSLAGPSQPRWDPHSALALAPTHMGFVAPRTHMWVQQLWSPVDMFKFGYLDLTIQGPPESVEKRVVGFRLKDFLVNDILKIANLLRNCLNLFSIKHCCLPQ